MHGLRHNTMAHRIRKLLHVTEEGKWWKTQEDYAREGDGVRM